MNIFFYSASVSIHAGEYFEALQACIAVQDIILLPNGSGLTSPSCLTLRSGDILILYAENDNAVESLLAMEEDLKDFRILLLISPGCSRYHRDSAYRLSPIFTTEPSTFAGLSAVIMNILLRNDAQQWSSTYSQEVI